jgi:molecular chaperone DnaJ
VVTVGGNRQIISGTQAMSKEDAHTVLGVAPTANEKTWRAAYRKSTLEYHPDRHPGQDEKYNKLFSTVNDAFSVLDKDSDQQKGEGGVNQSGTQTSNETPSNSGGGSDSNSSK